jgi:hypothetical protein
MIPPDLASRLQANTELVLRPVAPTGEIADKLSDFTAGQRLMAEVQALLPNGTYRALVNQRSITLALPFSARSGDSLELEVTESNGKLALAVISHRDGPGAGKEAVAATLSRTGQLISQLFSGARDAGSGGKALPLNANQPVAGTPPGNAQDILPLLKEAIARSGMFYESHQAEWIEGRFAKAELLREPQGKFSTPGDANAAQSSQTTRMIVLTDTPAGRAAQPLAPTAGDPASAPKAGEANPSAAGQTSQTIASADTSAGRAAPPLAPAAGDPATASKAGEASSPAAGQIVAPQLQGIVHQQLEALANQTFVWQGQIWPGQEMRWEIEEDGKNNQEDDEETESWRTRIDLSFPGLGGISARIQLLGKQVSLSLDVDNEASLEIMRADAETLRQHLENAGLTLASLGMALPAEQKTP